VTGGTGFVGSHTVEHLLQLGFRVRCVVRPERRNLGWLEGLPTENVYAHLHDAISLQEIVGGIDFLFHIAGVTKAKRSKEFFEGNVHATRTLLEAAAKQRTLKKFCLVSSLAAVGPSNDGTPLDESAPCRPITEYGRSKLQAEETALSFANQVPMTIIRPPAVYGPRDRDILELFRTAKWGFRPVLGPKDKTLSLIHVTDLARALVSATISDKTGGKIYFAADDRPYTYSELYDELSSIVGHSVVALPIPDSILYGLAAGVELVSRAGPRPAVLSIDKARDLIQRHWVCSGARLRKEVGFSTNIEIKAGLRSTYDWYETRGWLKLKSMFGYHD